MSILVANCFHWIGFHLINEYLTRGIEVSGYDKMDTSKKEHLSMFIGRNSLFSMVDQENSETYDTAIFIDDFQSSTIQASRKIRIGTEEYREDQAQEIHIQIPLLFGEWMPMNDKGVYSRGKLVSFDSKEFMEHAVYIDDFVQSFMQIMETPELQKELILRPKKNHGNEALKLENSLYIRDNVPIEENLNKVIAHYRKFKEMY